VVDDYEPWCSFASRTLREKPELQVVGEASDGLEAVHKTQRLQPDILLLDIGLPTINGIEAARRILQFAPETKIIFVSEQQSPDIVEEALRTGADGYVVKSKAATELLPAVEAVLQGKQFVSASLTLSAFSDPKKERTAHRRRRHEVALTPRSNVETVHHHEVGFYSDDRSLLDDLTQFIGAALEAGNAALVAATESHRNNLLAQLRAQGVDIGGAIEQGRYIVLDTADTLSMFMHAGLLDSAKFLEMFGNLIITTAKTLQVEHPRVAVFGECVNLLLVQGDAEAAIQMEKLGNQLANLYNVDILCGYSLAQVQAEVDTDIFERICAEHLPVHHK